MERRSFLGLAGGIAIVRAVPARARQPQRLRRIAVFSYLAAGDSVAQLCTAPVLQSLQELWRTVCRNLRIDCRLTEGVAEFVRRPALPRAGRHRPVSTGRRLRRRSLKGAKPADLPVHRSAKIDLVLNMNPVRPEEVIPWRRGATGPAGKVTRRDCASSPQS